MLSAADRDGATTHSGSYELNVEAKVRSCTVLYQATLMTDIAQATAPDALPEPDRSAIFTHLSRRLAAHRHAAQRYALAEADAAGLHVSDADTCTLPDAMGTATSDAFLRAIDAWAQEVLSPAWIACQQPGGGAPHSSSQSV
ncbi:hypothetical protein BC834DRAFT_853392 [Gloeopeniophorella convolvens]|nr:hypothetical protein BC834DRAFT_853392 [Gloeopeniophorella convolvens]